MVLENEKCPIINSDIDVESLLSKCLQQSNDNDTYSEEDVSKKILQYTISKSKRNPKNTEPVESDDQNLNTDDENMKSDDEKTLKQQNGIDKFTVKKKSKRKRSKA